MLDARAQRKQKESGLLLSAEENKLKGANWEYHSPLELLSRMLGAL